MNSNTLKILGLIVFVIITITIVVVLFKNSKNDKVQNFLGRMRGKSRLQNFLEANFTGKTSDNLNNVTVSILNEIERQNCRNSRINWNFKLNQKDTLIRKKLEPLLNITTKNYLTKPSTEAVENGLILYLTIFLVFFHPDTNMIKYTSNGQILSLKLDSRLAQDYSKKLNEINPNLSGRLDKMINRKTGYVDIPINFMIESFKNIMESMRNFPDLQKARCNLS